MGSLRHLKKYFARYKKSLAAGVLFILISNAGQVAIPLLLKDSINLLMEEVNYELLARYAFIIVGVAIVSGFFRFLIRQTIIVVSREIEYDLRQDFWAHLQKLSLRYFQNNSTGNLMAHATNDISAVRMFIGPAIMYSIDTGTKFIIIIIIMLSINPLLTVYSLLPLPFLSYAIYRISKKIHKMYTQIQEKFSELTTRAQESFAGIRVIKSYVRSNSEIKDFTILSNEYLNKNMNKVRIQALFHPVLFFITGISGIVVIWLGGGMIINGEMTIGEISAFIAYLGMLIWPVIAFGWVANIIQQADASMRRLKNILDEEYEITDPEKPEIKDLSGEIEFKNVTFSYSPGLPEVLKNVSFKISKGETVAIIGKTGVGKTSLVNLIPRMYDATSGEILIDGVNVKNMPLNHLRKAIGYVPQETFLFSETLKNNILYGIKDADESLLNKVAHISQLSKDVESFPKKYETILGEKGITLSGGQKQRTCLARALAVDPKILILDDSFSAVDTHTEEEILKRLKEYMINRTSIIISHRISTVKEADRIYVLDEGIIKEQGTHSELVELKGIYADINYKQMLEEELKTI
ncbi:MAG: ABC transporter ATP-binding protein [Ignavibacteria bacterium]|nr:ABC transporter ATP-binding protein [Ignavibacteria bacterium]